VTTCSVGTINDCFNAHGRFLGLNSTCSSTACAAPPPPPARGACCVSDPRNAAFVACAVLTSDNCTRANGTYQGDNTTCTATTCPRPTVGACCIAATTTTGAHCHIGTAAACTTAGGTYGGDNSTCRSANCPTSCPCDWDHSGGLNGNDIISFLTDWLAGHGDFNGDGTTNQQDLSDFLGCIRNPPAGCRGGGNGP